MEFIGNKSIYFIVSFLFIMNCVNNNQKVYKQFDTMDISTTQSSKPSYIGEHYCCELSF